MSRSITPGTQRKAYLGVASAKGLGGLNNLIGEVGGEVGEVGDQVETNNKN